MTQPAHLQTAVPFNRLNVLENLTPADKARYEEVLKEVLGSEARYNHSTVMSRTGAPTEYTVYVGLKFAMGIQIGATVIHESESTATYDALIRALYTSKMFFKGNTA